MLMGGVLTLTAAAVLLCNSKVDGVTTRTA